MMEAIASIAFFLGGIMLKNIFGRQVNKFILRHLMTGGLKWAMPLNLTIVC